jgi:DNA-binding LytR/AlgR family response regulator
MNRHLIIKTRDEFLRIRISDILYLEADRNYTKLLLTEGIQFTFAINLGKIEEMLESQTRDAKSMLIRVGKSYVINKNYILQINLPRQKLLLLPTSGKPRELVVPKEPLKVLKETLEQEGTKSQKKE